MKKFQHFPKILGYSFLLSFAFIATDQIANQNMLAAMDISIIPSSGTLSSKFQTGDFNFSDILVYGMYLIKMGGVLAGVVYMIMNMWGGIRYITGSIAGEEEEAKNTLVNAFIGFAVAVFSWILVDIVVSFLT
jgi:hypothetical protein